eukprot:283348_1
MNKTSSEDFGMFSLILYHLPDGITQKTINCDFFCKEIYKLKQQFYVRFQNYTLKLNGSEKDSRMTAFFDWRRLKSAVTRKKKTKNKYGIIKWVISIGDASANNYIDIDVHKLVVSSRPAKNVRYSKLPDITKYSNEERDELLKRLMQYKTQQTDNNSSSTE